MTDRQYADMTTIMQFCRIFADQMDTCLKHSGLYDKGFSLSLHVGNKVPYEEGVLKTNKIELSESITDVGYAQYASTEMMQMNIADKGWIVYDDPRNETGSLPNEVCFKARRDFRKAMAEETEHPYPPDGLWIGADYNNSDVDHRR